MTTRDFFAPGAAAEFQRRIGLLGPEQQRLWGKMTVSQMLSHTSLALEMAVGDLKPKRMMIGRVIGPIITRLALGNERPLKRESPTAPDLVVRNQPQFEVERARLSGLVERFAAGGPSKVTSHPHTFFGRLTPAQWSELMYKHLDHHLRQFGA
jgi:hypothetical protein